MAFDDSYVMFAEGAVYIIVGVGTKLNTMQGACIII